jgi:hypothetical protein
MDYNEKATELVGLIDKLIGIKKAVRGTVMAMIAEGKKLMDRYPGGVCGSLFLGELFRGQTPDFPVAAKKYYPTEDEIHLLVQKKYLDGDIIKEKNTKTSSVIRGMIMKAYISSLCNRVKFLARQMDLRRDEKSLEHFCPDRLDYPDADKLLELREEAEGYLQKNVSSKKSLSVLDLKDPVACKEVAEFIHKQSGNVARELRNRNFPVVTVKRINFCEAEHAGIVWPKFRNHWNNE